MKPSEFILVTIPLGLLALAALVALIDCAILSVVGWLERRRLRRSAP